MDMSEEKESKLSFLGIFPRCPFYKPLNQLFVLAALTFGTWGVYYLNLWATVGFGIYAVLYFYFVMPIWHCKFCYYKVYETRSNTNDGKITKKLLQVEKWKESYLAKHVTSGKRWGINFTIILFTPIILTIISFILNFNYLAIIALIGFITSIALLVLYMKKKTCENCPIKEECHSSF